MCMNPKLPPQRRKLSAAGKGGAAAGAAGVAALLWHINVESASKPVSIWTGEGDLKEKVLPHVPLLVEQPFRPSPWATNTHAQTILGFLRGLSLDAKYRRQLIIAHDGGTLGLDWFHGSDTWETAAPDAPILLVLHGINGGSHEGYCKWSCSSAYHRGWRSCALNCRGCNGLPLTSPRGYAPSLTHDIHYAITSIKARFPKAPLFAVGYSLGALFLTKYLAEADHGLHASMAANSSAFEPFEGSGLVAAACVSCPICLSNNSSHLSKPWTTGYLYNLAVALKVREFMQEHRASILAGGNFDVDKAMACWTVNDIEDAGLPYTLGFNNRHEYYEQVSSLQYIPHIRTPTLFLNARDDPFLGVLPDEECTRNPNTVLAATSHGGHVAFLQGWKPFGPAWMDHVVLQFMNACAAHYPASARAESMAAAHAGAQEQREELHQLPPEAAFTAQLHQQARQLEQERQQLQQQQGEKGYPGEGGEWWSDAGVGGSSQPRRWLGMDKEAAGEAAESAAAGGAKGSLEGQESNLQQNQQQPQQHQGDLHMESSGGGALRQQQQPQAQAGSPHCQEKDFWHATHFEGPAATNAAESLGVDSDGRSAANTVEESRGSGGVAAWGDGDAEESDMSRGVVSRGNSGPMPAVANRGDSDAGGGEAHEMTAQTAGGGGGRDGGTSVVRGSGNEVQDHSVAVAAAAGTSSVVDSKEEEAAQLELESPPSGARAPSMDSATPSAEREEISYSLVGSEGGDGAAGEDAGSAENAGAHTPVASEPHAPQGHAAVSSGAGGLSLDQESTETCSTQGVYPSPVLAEGGERDLPHSHTGRPYHIKAGEGLQQHPQHQQQQSSMMAPSAAPAYGWGHFSATRSRL